MEYTKEDFKNELELLKAIKSQNTLNESGKGRLEMAEKVEKLI